MLIQVFLVADDAGEETSVSTTITVDRTDPRWSAWLVDAVTGQAQEGARRLRDQLVGQQAIQGTVPAGVAFVPLAAVVPAVDAAR